MARNRAAVLFSHTGEVHPPELGRFLSVAATNAVGSATSPAGLAGLTVLPTHACGILNIGQVLSHASGVVVEFGALGHLRHRCWL